MHSRSFFIRSACATFLILAGLLINVPALKAQTIPSSSVQGVSEDPVAKINQKAAAIKSADPKQIGELVDAVIASHGLLRDSVDADGALREAFVQAEFNYHTGKHKGVSEAAVAQLVNRLADKFGTPPYTHTTASEVRRLRVQMLFMNPGLIGIEPVISRTQKPSGDLKRTMSPLEAVHVTATLIFQKMNNPEWQLTPEEFKATWAVRHSGNYKPSFDDTTRSIKVHLALVESSKNVSLRDALTVVEDGFRTFGIGGGQ